MTTVMKFILIAFLTLLNILNQINFPPEFLCISTKFSRYDPLTKFKSNASKHAIQNSYPLFKNENPIQFYQK